jgi:UDPglucose 6-dehydrogenase
MEVIMGTIRAVVVLCLYLIIASYFSLSAYTHHKPDAPAEYPTIAVIGTGYVGLVTGAGLASFGNKVICVDIAAEKIAQLNAGIIPIYEPDLKELVEYGIDQEQLSFTTDIASALERASVIFIAVGTPMDDGGAADMRAFNAVAETIAAHLHEHKTIVTKSTVPIGTGRNLEELFIEIYDIDPKLFTVVSNPEFLREGSAVYDFLNPDRVVIGTDDERGFDELATVYHQLIEDGVPFVWTNLPTAELIKYASNAFLATKLSFINEIANLCDATGAHVKTVAYAMGLDSRISPRFLNPGPGYGGSCFPKDTQALVHIANQHGVTLNTVMGGMETNTTQQLVPLQKLHAIMPSCTGKTIGILGLAFKANTDDIRYSPALTVISALLEENATIYTYDPAAMPNTARQFADISYCNSAYEAVTGTDAVIIMTEWDEFRHLNLEKVRHLMRGNIIIDARNLLHVEQAQQHGFYYDGIGIAAQQ